MLMNSRCTATPNLLSGGPTRRVGAVGFQLLKATALQAGAPMTRTPTTKAPPNVCALQAVGLPIATLQRAVARQRKLRSSGVGLSLEDFGLWCTMTRQSVPIAPVSGSNLFAIKTDLLPTVNATRDPIGGRR